MSLRSGRTATSMVAHTEATAPGPSVAWYIRLDRPTMMAVQNMKMIDDNGVHYNYIIITLVQYEQLI